MAQERIGTKRLVVGAHYGTIDFIVQRITAVIMIIYTLVFLVGVLLTPELNYEGWRNLFAFKAFGALPIGQLLTTLFFIQISRTPIQACQAKEMKNKVVKS